MAPVNHNELIAPNVWRLGVSEKGDGYIALYVNSSRSISSSRWFQDADSAKHFAQTGIAP